MKPVLRLTAVLGLLLGALSPVRAQRIAAAPAAVAPVGGALGAAGALVPGDVRAAMDLYFPDLRTDIGPGIEALKADIRSESDAGKRGALLAVYDALRQESQDKSSALSQAGLPKSVTLRLTQIGARLRRKPELAGRLTEDLAAAHAPALQEAPPPAAHDAADQARRLLESLKGASEPGPAPAAWNGQDYPSVVFPTDGSDPLAHWLRAHQQADELHQANYNFDLMEMAQSIVDQSKKGRPQVLVGDFSNWFPKKSAPSDQEVQPAAAPADSARSPAMELILQNLGPNLKLFITKGIGSIGINHNKFSRFLSKAGEALGQGGSANYSQTSFTPKTLSHWENVYFYADKARTDLDELYFQWLLRRAKPFSEDLSEKDVEPVFDPKDPIPVDPHPSVAFGGKMFPLNSFSPNGGTEDWLALAQSLSDAGVDILMFSPFPTDRIKAGLMDLLKAGKPVRMLADRGQLHNALPHLADLVQAGMKLKAIGGPDLASRDMHQKMHNKIMRFKRADGQGLLKRGSLNISQNALGHNFENNPFNNEAELLRLYDDYFEMLWAKGEAPAPAAPVKSLLAGKPVSQRPKAASKKA